MLFILKCLKLNISCIKLNVTKPVICVRLVAWAQSVPLFHRLLCPCSLWNVQEHQIVFWRLIPMYRLSTQRSGLPDHRYQAISRFVHPYLCPLYSNTGYNPTIRYHSILRPVSSHAPRYLWWRNLHLNCHKIFKSLVNL